MKSTGKIVNTKFPTFEELNNGSDALTQKIDIKKCPAL